MRRSHCPLLQERLDPSRRRTANRQQRRRRALRRGTAATVPAPRGRWRGWRPPRGEALAQRRTGRRRRLRVGLGESSSHAGTGSRSTARTPRSAAPSRTPPAGSSSMPSARTGSRHGSRMSRITCQARYTVPAIWMKTARSVPLLAQPAISVVEAAEEQPDREEVDDLAALPDRDVAPAGVGRAPPVGAATGRTAGVDLVRHQERGDDEEGQLGSRGRRCAVSPARRSPRRRPRTAAW